MTRFIVVRGKQEWAITVGDCVYAIYGSFSSCKEGVELEEEQKEYALKQMIEHDGSSVPRSLITYYKDISFGHTSMAGSTEFVVEHDLNKIWYGFIDEKDILKVLDTTNT